MEPVPNAPLPWKGVFMILLPGLVYLVSQIAQLTGQAWYMTVYYRAAFVLILPVLAVWAITRRFPIWGLIPAGLLYKLVQEIGYQLIVLHPDVFSSNPLLNTILTFAKMIQKELLILVVVFIAGIVLLAVRYIRQQKPARGFWIWGGAYLVLALAQTINGLQWLPGFVQENTPFFVQSEIWNMLHAAIAWDLYNLSAFLLLIFIGTLFTRRHGFFSILILVGYILPTIVIGTPLDLDMLPNQTLVVAVISAAVLAYRGLLSLIAPIWMSRTRTQTGKKRAVIISIALALAVHAVMQFYPLMFSSEQSYISTQWVVSVVLDECKLISAFLLAMVMYQDIQPQPAAPAQSFGVFPEITVEKA
jgi:hypothetical protein